MVNLNTGKFVQVRITDRGPYIIGRMLDLSHAAARELGMMEAGTAAVHIEVIGRAQLMRPLPPQQLSAGIHVHSNGGRVPDLAR